MRGCHVMLTKRVSHAPCEPRSMKGVAPQGDSIDPFKCLPKLERL